jgi:hypothetical protein
MKCDFCSLHSCPCLRQHVWSCGSKDSIVKTNKFFIQLSKQTHNSSDTISYAHIQCLWQTVNDVRQSVTRKDKTQLRKSDTHLDIEKNSDMLCSDIRIRGAALSSTQTSAPFPYSEAPSCKSRQINGFTKVYRQIITSWRHMSHYKCSVHCRTELRGLSPRANYTDRAAVAGRRS